MLPVPGHMQPWCRPRRRPQAPPSHRTRPHHPPCTSAAALAGTPACGSPHWAPTPSPHTPPPAALPPPPSCFCGKCQPPPPCLCGQRPAAPPSPPPCPPPRAAACGVPQAAAAPSRRPGRAASCARGRARCASSSDSACYTRARRPRCPARRDRFAPRVPPSPPAPHLSQPPPAPHPRTHPWQRARRPRRPLAPPSAGAPLRGIDTPAAPPQRPRTPGRLRALARNGAASAPAQAGLVAAPRRAVQSSACANAHRQPPVLLQERTEEIAAGGRRWAAERDAGCAVC